MIFSIVILVFVGAVAFFHYTQGFFSATLSAMAAVIAAVLAFSYHETIVENFLGGRFSDAAHAMSLAVLFALIYFVLRVCFDRMVPGNVRFPVMVDRVGGGAMGLIAGVFAGGILAIVAQYLPLSPSIAGYSRYASESSRLVTVPPEATNGRAQNSETWDGLKSETPGTFEQADKQTMIVPIDDIVVNTVSKLSGEGGSLGWDRPLEEVHPDFLSEVFGQRLGIQPRATRVATKDGIGPVELFRVDSLARKDHEYKDIRQRQLETTPLKPKANEVIVIARVIFKRPASDKDGVVRFSPGSVRLVARKGGGGSTAGAEWVDYYPVGTVDGARVLYGDAMDDFLFVDAKGADRGADFAFVVDKSALEGGKGAAMRAPEGTFLEIKRMARQDLSNKEVKPPTAYKPSENIAVMRKKQPQNPADATAADTSATPAAPGTSADSGATALKDKLVGNWMGSSETGQLAIEFKADGTLTFNNTPKGGVPTVGQGSWTVVPEKSTADTLVINRTVNNATAENMIKFTGESTITLSSPGRPVLTLNKR